MFELHAVMAEDARRSSQDTNSVMEALLVNFYGFFLFENLVKKVKHILQRSKLYLEQAENMLKYEPKELPEGQMAEQCKKNAIDLDLLLKQIHESIGSTPM